MNFVDYIQVILPLFSQQMFYQASSICQALGFVLGSQGKHHTHSLTVRKTMQLSHKQNEVKSTRKERQREVQGPLTAGLVFSPGVARLAPACEG